MPKITLPERCDRSAAEALLPELIDLVAVGDAEIDASAVTRIGQPMLQLLVSARRSGEVRITPSAELEEAARLAGLESILFDEGAP